MNPYHNRSYRQIFLMAFAKAGIRFQHSPSRWSKPYAADALSPDNTEDDDNALSDNEVHGFFIPQEIFACAPKTKTTNFEFIEELKCLFVAFTMEVCMAAGIMENNKGKISTISELASLQFTGANCRSAFTFVGRPITLLHVESDGVFFRIVLYMAQHRVSYQPPYFLMFFSFVNILFCRPPYST